MFCQCGYAYGVVINKISNTILKELQKNKWKIHFKISHMEFQDTKKAPKLFCKFYQNLVQ